MHNLVRGDPCGSSAQLRTYIHTYIVGTQPFFLGRRHYEPGFLQQFHPSAYERCTIFDLLTRGEALFCSVAQAQLVSQFSVSSEWAKRVSGRRESACECVRDPGSIVVLDLLSSRRRRRRPKDVRCPGPIWASENARGSNTSGGIMCISTFPPPRGPKKQRNGMPVIAYLAS